jgi:hypothetical protein
MRASSEDSETFCFEHFILDVCRISRKRRKLRQDNIESREQTNSHHYDEKIVLSTVGDQLMRSYVSKPGSGRNKNRRRADGALLLNRDFSWTTQLMTMWSSKVVSGNETCLSSIAQ